MLIKPEGKIYMAVGDLSQRIIKLSQRIEDLQQQSVSDPANAAEVLCDVLRELQSNLEELSAIDEELHQQNEELTKAQEALRESEEKYRTAIDFTCDCETWLSPEGNYIYVSPSCEHITGYSADEFLKDPGLFEKIVHPDDRELYPRHFHKNDDEVVPVDFRIIDRNGEERWISHVCQPVYGSDGRYLGRRASNRDITEQKRAEESLRKSEEMLNRAQEIAHLGSWELDLLNNRLSWSDEVYRIFGLQPQEFGATYEAFLDAVHPDDRAAVDAAYSGSLRDGRYSYEIEHRVVRKSNGEVRIVHEKCEHIRDGSGKIIRSVGMVHDITDLKQAVKEIESLAKFPGENPNPILRIATDGTIIYANRGSVPLLELWGCQVGQILSEDYRNLIQGVLRSGISREIEILLGCATYSLVLAPIAEMGYVNIYGRDITARKQAEIALQGANEELEVIAEELRQQNDELIGAQSALQESEEKYRTIVETANEGIWVVDSETRTTYVNRRMAEMLGYGPEEMIGKKSSEFMDDEGKARLGLLLEHRRQGIIESFEFKFIRKDGLPLWAISSAAPLRDKEGKFAGSLGMLTDITERKRAEEALLESEERYATTLASIGDAVIATDMKGRITFMNAVAEGLTGWTLDDAMMKPAKNVFNIINEYTRHKVDDPITKVLKNGVIVGLANHTILVRRDGTEVAIDDSGAPIKDLTGNTIGVVLVFRDITERKRAEEELLKARNDLELKVQKRTAELQKALEAAEESARAKAAFLANMSHELRTPMNAVIGFSSLLLDDNLTQEQEEYIEGIRKGGEALLAIINDILDFSRAENNKLELEHQPFSLKHCIDESLGLVAVQASKKGLNLSETINYGTPDTIIGDQGRLRQILVNLLTNAVKFTDKGNVSVSVSSKAVEGNRRQIFFEVKDTGIGIPQNRMNEIFEPFVQVERTLSRKRDGVGLGLAITKNLVELMGGKIQAESIPGQGSTFRFMILAETIPGKQLDFGKIDRGVAFENIPGLKPMRILVAEDNPSNQRVLVEMLKRLGYRADAVADGREVIQALERQDYDLVLMDIKMPEMDGITATQVIRKLRPIGGPKIVAITAFALEGDREKCLEAGMEDYISKPVKMAELADILRKYQ